MKKQMFLKPIQTTATLICCAVLFIGNDLLLPGSNTANNAPIIEIENLTSEDNTEDQYTPQDDDIPFGSNTDN